MRFSLSRLLAAGLLLLVLLRCMPPAIASANGPAQPPNGLNVPEQPKQKPSDKPIPPPLRSIYGTVTRVFDGDTLDIATGTGSQSRRIRLYGIDAPEASQPYYQASKNQLKTLVLGKEICVKYTETDQYGRLIGRIYLDEQDISLIMLQQGLAWHYKAYDTTKAYATAETRARTRRKGLWKDPAPTPPWTFRHRHNHPRQNHENKRNTQ